MTQQINWKLLRKTLSIIPYVLILAISDLILAQPQSQPLSEVMWYSIFGRMTEGDLQALILSFEALGYLFLFSLLFGGYISDFFGLNSAVIFTRIHRRTGWMMRKIRNLFLLSFLYTTMLLLLKFLMGLRKVFNWKPDGHFLWILLLLFGILLPLLATISLAVNWISIRYHTSLGIVAAFILVLLLAVLGIMKFRSTANMIWNPLCFNITILITPYLGILKIASNLFYFAILSSGFICYINKKDIF